VNDAFLPVCAATLSRKPTSARLPYLLRNSGVSRIAMPTSRLSSPMRFRPVKPLFESVSDVRHGYCAVLMQLYG
jgi:hypothetical protein